MPLGDGGAVAIVAVEELQDPGGLAERGDPLVEAGDVDRVDDPDACRPSRTA